MFLILCNGEPGHFGSLVVQFVTKYPTQPSDSDRMNEMCKSYFNTSTEFQNEVKVAVLQDNLPLIMVAAVVIIIVFAACFGPAVGSKCKTCCKK